MFDKCTVRQGGEFFLSAFLHIMGSVQCRCGQNYSGMLTLIHPPTSLFLCLWNVRPNWKQSSNFTTALSVLPLWRPSALDLDFHLLLSSSFLFYLPAPPTPPWIMMGWVEGLSVVCLRLLSLSPFFFFILFAGYRIFLLLCSVSLVLRLPCLGSALFILFSAVCVCELINPMIWAKEWLVSW